MSNQRPLKMHRAAASNNECSMSLRELKTFALLAQKELEAAGEGDAAYYFGQLADFIADSPEKLTSTSVSRVLGL
jgi:hypothetical protein